VLGVGEDETKPEKVLLILHGVTGNSEEDYVCEMVGTAAERGFTCVVLNHFAPKNEQNLRLLNFT
jgi:predicted alpha/beta-fold hydrolase